MEVARASGNIEQRVCIVCTTELQASMGLVVMVSGVQYGILHFSSRSAYSIYLYLLGWAQSGRDPDAPFDKDARLAQE